MKIQSMMLGVIIILFSLPAMAYIDPSSGSAIISAFIGIFVALSMTIKTYWYKIKSFIRLGDKAGEEKNNDNEEIVEVDRKDF